MTLTQSADRLRSSSRSFAAEVRAVESGRRCRLDHVRDCFVVHSDTTSASYELRARGEDGLLVISCTCSWGRTEEPVPGRLGCWHSALVARRLERHGLVKRDEGVWRITERGERLAG